MDGVKSDIRFHDETQRNSINDRGEQENKVEVLTTEPQLSFYHQNKTQVGTVQIDVGQPHSLEQGCGLSGESVWVKCAVFCGNICGCPSRKEFKIGSFRVISRVVMAVLFWAFVYAITFPICKEKKSKDTNESTTTCEVEGLPGGNLFGIVTVFIFGMMAEALIILIPMPCNLPALPPLLGSLLVGIMLGNVPGITVAKHIDPIWSTRLRNLALGVILARAGLEVDKKQLYKLRFVVPRLAFLPCIVEACSYGVLAHFAFDLPWEWSFMLGFVCSAVAPACVVPSMIKFQEQGYGCKHGVPSLLIAGASIDDIVAINAFNILLTVTFGGKGIGYSIGIAVAEVAGGIVFGLIGGLFLQKIPDRRQHNVIRDRTFLLAIYSFFLIFITNGPLDLAGAGTLGTLVCSFVAASGWREDQSELVAHHFKALWFYFQPLLFGLTGATLDFTKIDPQVLAYGLVVIVISLTIRLFVAGNSVSFLGWSHKEKLMTAIAWIPKATVQAAIGGAAFSRVELECAKEFGMTKCSSRHDLNGSLLNITNFSTVATDPPTEELLECIDPNHVCFLWLKYAEIILTIAVLLILITAPVGVFLIGIFGPKLLSQEIEFRTTDKAYELRKGEGINQTISKVPSQSSLESLGTHKSVESGVCVESGGSKLSIDVIGTGSQNHAFYNSEIPFETFKTKL